MLFQDISLDERVLLSARERAKTNWEWWKEDFLHTCEFCKMPVLASYPRFRGFGADYSVFRGLKTDKIEEIREWLLQSSDPNDFAELFEAFQEKFGDKPKRVSLISKLLGMWKPQKFAMWDTLARSGLKKLHHSTRGHCYSRNTSTNYDIYNSDFSKLLSQSQGQLRSLNVTDDFAPRVLDNYLMLNGKQK